MTDPVGNSSSNDPTYQSDHNPVYSYFPRLIDTKYNVAIFTYNEKGQTTTPKDCNQFINKCGELENADIVIIGIQEGDANKVFVNTLSESMNKFFGLNKDSKNNETGKEEIDFFSEPILAGQHDLEWTDTGLFSSNMYGLENAKLRFGGGEPGTPSNITPKEITYKSVGKECKLTNPICLLNGLYVLIRPNLVETLQLNPDSGTATLNSIPFFSKHIAWVCIESSTTKAQYVFFSCHLEYNGSKSNAPTGFKYPQRKAQLDSYISSMTTKFPDAEMIMCLGDTNMRTFYVETGIANLQPHMHDQMLQYLLQLAPESIADYGIFNKNYNAGEIPNFNATITKYTNTITLYTLIGCKINDNGTNLIFCKGDKNTKTTSINPHMPILTKVNKTYKYRSSSTKDIYAPYCINPEFQLGNTTYRAYDFTYTPGNDNTDKDKELYAYPPTAIYKLTYPREFDMAKREKSGNIMAPSHTDRILMFRPIHTTKKINFMLLK